MVRSSSVRLELDMATEGRTGGGATVKLWMIMLAGFDLSLSSPIFCRCSFEMFYKVI